MADSKNSASSLIASLYRSCHAEYSHEELLLHLRSIKNIYLVDNNSESIMRFLKSALHTLDETQTEQTTKNINIIFQSIVRKMMPNDKSVLDHFYFVIPSTVEDSIGKNSWDRIILKYKVPSQYEFLFYGEAFSVYNAMFRFLLNVKQAPQLWHLSFGGAHSEEIYWKALMLRNHIVGIFIMLDNYLHEVLDNQYRLMENSIKNGKIFDDIQKAHAIFLSNIVLQSFLPTDPKNSKEPGNYFIQQLVKLKDDLILRGSTWEFKAQISTESEEVRIFYERLNSIPDLAKITMDSIRDKSSREHFKILLSHISLNGYARLNYHSQNLKFHETYKKLEACGTMNNPLH